MQLFMRNNFRYLKQDKLLQRLFILSFILIVITTIYTLFSYSKLPPLLPIFNQLPWGEKRLSGTPGIFIPSILVFLILIFNMVISVLFYQRSPLISRILAITSFLTAFMVLLFIVRTIQLVI